MMKLKAILAYVLVFYSFVFFRFTSFCKRSIVSLLGNYLIEGSLLNWVVKAFTKSSAIKFLSFVMSPIVRFKDFVIFSSASTVLDNFSPYYPLQYPIVECSIFGESFAAFTDTGANCNIATKKLYRFCIGKIKLTRVQANVEFTNSEQKKSSFLKGYLRVTIENQEFLAPFLFCPSWKGRMLLGRDFLRRSKIFLNIYDNVWYFRNSSSRMHRFISETNALAIESKWTSSGEFSEDECGDASGIQNKLQPSGVTNGPAINESDSPNRNELTEDELREVQLINVSPIEIDFQIFGRRHKIMIDSAGGSNYGSRQLYDLCKTCNIKMKKAGTVKYKIPTGEFKSATCHKACIPLQLNEHTYYTTFNIFKDLTESQTRLGVPFLMQAPIILTNFDSETEGWSFIRRQTLMKIWSEFKTILRTILGSYLVL